jgi:hypothetical protein
MCFFNNGGHPTWQIIDDEKAIEFLNRVGSNFLKKNNKTKINGDKKK